MSEQCQWKDWQRPGREIGEGSRKRRRGGVQILQMEYVKEKSGKEMDCRRDELEMRKKEIELRERDLMLREQSERERKDERMLAMLAEQQTQQQVLITQLQQQMTTFDLFHFHSHFCISF